MKAVRLHGTQDARVEDVPMPQCGPQDLLVQVSACGVCGSDYRTFRSGVSGHGLELPRIMGHESSGIVVEAGAVLANAFPPGTPVAVGAVGPCGICHNCRRGIHNMCEDRQVLGYQHDGAMAEFLRVPTRLVAHGQVIRLAEPGNRLPMFALAEPLSCAINGQEISQVGLGDIVVVVGAGPLGLMHLEVALNRGAAKVLMVEWSEARRTKSLSLGASAACASMDEAKDLISEWSQGRGADVAIVAAPSPQGVAEALSLLGRRGRLNIFGGMPRGQEEVVIAANEVHYKELSIQGTSDSGPQHLQQAVDLIARGVVHAEEILSDKVFPSDVPALLSAGLTSGIKAFVQMS